MGTFLLSVSLGHFSPFGQASMVNMLPMAHRILSNSVSKGVGVGKVVGSRGSPVAP